MPLNLVSLEVKFQVEGETFTVYTNEQMLYVLLDEKNEHVYECDMDETALEIVARDLPSAIMKHVVQPHMVVQSDKSLLTYYLDCMNIANMFYLRRVTQSQNA